MIIRQEVSGRNSFTIAAQWSKTLGREKGAEDLLSDARVKTFWVSSSD